MSFDRYDGNLSSEERSSREDDSNRRIVKASKTAYTQSRDLNCIF